MKSKTFMVPGIHCGHCTNTIEKELLELDGVLSVKADKDTKIVKVEWNEKETDWNEILELLEEINFLPEIV